MGASWREGSDRAWWTRETAVRGGPGRYAPGPSVVPGRPPARLRGRARGPRWRSRPAGTRCTGAPPRPRRSRSAARASAPERAQEATVGHVLPRDRALAAPARPAQGVEAAVVAGAGVGVRGDGTVVGQGVLGEHGPGQAGCRVRRGHLLGCRPSASGVGGGVLGQVGRRDAEQVGAHGVPPVGGWATAQSALPGGAGPVPSRVENTPCEVDLARRVLYARPLGVGRVGRVSPGACPPSAGSGRPRRRGRPCRPRPPCPRRGGRTASCCRPRRRSSARRCSSSASSRRPGG